MGNKVLSHPRVILTSDIALHFKASQLKRDVFSILKSWSEQGAELCLTKEEFKKTFDLVHSEDSHFQTFDTDKNGKIDTFEVLMVYILLAEGSVSEKVDATFSVFEFGGPSVGSINFDEAVMLVGATVRGIHKVCEGACNLSEEEILWLCQSMFDMHRLPYAKRIQRAEFKDWVRSDPHPLSFVEAFHNSQSLSDVKAALLKRDREQGAVFKSLCNGSPTASPEALIQSHAFAKALGAEEEDEVAQIVNLMTDNGKEQHISVERFHAILRTYNIFLECDLDRSGFLDERELDILLWIQMRARPTSDFVHKFLEYIDVNADGQVSRMEWVTCVTTNRLYGGNLETAVTTGRR